MSDWNGDSIFAPGALARAWKQRDRVRGEDAKQGFGWHCDRGYTRIAPWRCPNCNKDSQVRGHICRDHHRRICCTCFDHLDAACRFEHPCISGISPNTGTKND